mmetsp:Transcript_35727/g.55829  ORF Transcript_35727/g.55829 Transcript_35727/m.55829 type:complete len:203 (+) Transcript_35727:352-960(+)
MLFLLPWGGAMLYRGERKQSKGALFLFIITLNVFGSLFLFKTLQLDAVPLPAPPPAPPQHGPPQPPDYDRIFYHRVTNPPVPPEVTEEISASYTHDPNTWDYCCNCSLNSFCCNFFCGACCGDNAQANRDGNIDCNNRKHVVVDYRSFRIQPEQGNPYYEAQTRLTRTLCYMIYYLNFSWGWGNYVRNRHLSQPSTVKIQSV